MINNVIFKTEEIIIIDRCTQNKHCLGFRDFITYSCEEFTEQLVSDLHREEHICDQRLANKKTGSELTNILPIHWKYFDLKDI